MQAKIIIQFNQLKIRLFKVFKPYALLSVLFCQCLESTGNDLGFLDRDKLLGDLGHREYLNEHYGIQYDLIYTGEVFSNLRGGINTHDATEYMGDISLYLELDTAAAGLWNDGMFFLHLQSLHGNGITDEHVGDFQLLSNIDDNEFQQVSEIWYEHQLWDETVRLKFGKMEANTDFAFVEYGIEFINSSPGFSPTLPLVSYPDQDWGFVIGFKPVHWYEATFGVYQGDPNGGRSITNTLDNLRGPMILFENALYYDLANHPGSFRIGTWWNGHEFENFDNTEKPYNENYGVYLTWDQLAWKENPAEDDEQGIGIFSQFGWSPEDRNEAEYYYGAGMQWTGMIPTRDEDAIGAGVFHTVFSDDAGFVDNSETAIELFYIWQATGWMTIKPDIQYITNPGGTGLKDALAMGLRWEIVF